MVGVLLSERVHARGVEERPRLALGRVPERPHAAAVSGRHRHLYRMLDAVASANVLDDADGTLDGGRRIVLEPEGQREEEERLRVRRALDERVEGRVDREHELALHVMELRDRAVVHPEPRSVPKTDGSSSAVSACPLTRGCGGIRARSGCGRRARAGSRSFHAGSTLLKSAGVSLSPYQPTPKPSPLVVSTPSRECRLWSTRECRGLVQQVLEEDRRPRVCDPAAHCAPFFSGRMRSRCLRPR